MFWIAPHLINVYDKSCQGRSAFKALRHHLCLLQQPDYIDRCVADLHMALQSEAPTTTTPPRRDVDEAQIRNFCKRGLFHKCLHDDDVEVVQPSHAVHAALSDLFPQSDLPDPIPTGDLPAPFYTYSQCRQAFQRVKKHKSPGLSGWTRELLFPLFLNPVPAPVKHAIASLFTTFVNVDRLTLAERQILKTGSLLPFYYRAKNKYRPIVILETISKMMWVLALTDIDDTNLMKTGHTACRKGSTQLAVHCIQEALHAGRPVLCMDASNAFNTLSRFDAVKYMSERRNIYAPCLQLYNMMYAEPSTVHMFDCTGVSKYSITVTTGTRQGCTSGPWLYMVGTMLVSLKYKGKLVQVADDVFLVSADAQQIVPDVLADFRLINQRLDGPKMQWLCPPNVALSTRVPVRSKVTGILGSFVQPSTTTRTETAVTISRLWLTPIREKFQRLVRLPTTVQNKVLILRSLTWNFLYAAECFRCDVREDIFVELDDIQVNTLIEVLRLQTCTREEKRNFHVQAFLPTQDGGFGLLPYAHLHESICSRSLQQASEFIARFSLVPPICIDPGVQSSLHAQWRAALRDDVRGFRVRSLTLSATSFLRRPYNVSWLDTRPINSIRFLEDEYYLFAARLKCKLLEPRSYHCPISDCDIGEMDRLHFTNHVISCCHCAAPAYHIRHEKVVYVLARTLRFHGIIATANPQGFPIPGNTRGGPDLMMYGRETHAIDVAVSKEKLGGNLESALQAVYLGKKADYKTYATLTHHTVTPFVLSIYGDFHRATLDFIGDLKLSTEGRYDIMANVQCELIVGMKQGFDLLFCKGIAGRCSDLNISLDEYNNRNRNTNLTTTTKTTIGLGTDVSS